MSDVIAYAAQMGRLDFLSVVLAALSIILALGGIFAFLEIRVHAKAKATTVAEFHAKIVAERVANEYMQKNFPEITKSYAELFMNPVGTSEADEIARAQSEDSNESNK